ELQGPESCAQRFGVRVAHREGGQLASWRRVRRRVGGIRAPFDEEGQHPAPVVLEVQRPPPQELAIGPLSRAGEDWLRLDVRRCQRMDERVEVVDVRYPFEQARRLDLVEAAHV